MVKITRGGAVLRLLLTALVGFIGGVMLSAGSASPSWEQVTSVAAIAKGILASAFAVERFINTSWAQAHLTDPPPALSVALLPAPGYSLAQTPTDGAPALDVAPVAAAVVLADAPAVIITPATIAPTLSAPVTIAPAAFNPNRTLMGETLTGEPPADTDDSSGDSPAELAADQAADQAAATAKGGV